MTEYIRRDLVLRCIKESRDGIDWGQSEDEDAFLHYSACLYRTIASIECLPDACVEKVVHCKDCKHLDYDGELFCEYFQRGIEGKDFFCAHGERRTNWLNT